MNARGFIGHFPVLSAKRFTWLDGVFGAAAAAACVCVRIIL
jgi:hypothetical protein